MIPTDELNRMLVEVSTGQEGPSDESPEKKAMRAKLTAEVEEIVKSGDVVDMPGELA